VGNEGRNFRRIGPQVDVYPGHVTPQGLGELLPETGNTDQRVARTQHSEGLLARGKLSAVRFTDREGEAALVPVSALASLQEMRRIACLCRNCPAARGAEPDLTGRRSVKTHTDEPQRDSVFLSSRDEAVLNKRLAPAREDVDTVVELDGPWPIIAREPSPKPDDRPRN